MGESNFGESTYICSSASHTGRQVEFPHSISLFTMFSSHAFCHRPINMARISISRSFQRHTFPEGFVRVYNDQHLRSLPFYGLTRGGRTDGPSVHGHIDTLHNVRSHSQAR